MTSVIVIATIVSPVSSIPPNIPAFTLDSGAVSSYFRAAGATTNIITQLAPSC